MKKYFGLIFLAACLATAATGKRTLKNDKSNSSITYHCVHSLHEWTGVNKNADCIIIYNDESNAIEKVAVSQKASDFDSQNSNRDSHSLEVLEALQYPLLTFVSTAITPAGDTLNVTGNLTFHGVTKSISFHAAREDKGKQITVKGGFSLLLSDYKVERPSFMLVQMEDKTDIAFEMVFSK